MNITDIKKIELEITSACNAACPGCARTQNLDILEIKSMSLNDIKRLFPTIDYIKDKQFKFCGVLGDPILNKDCLNMIEYISTQGGKCEVSTNGGYQNINWWSKLGKLSAETGNINIHFCVDGHRETNHIYRVNTVFNVIERNMQAYANGGAGNARATWIFIVFDHNEHELEAAKIHAKNLGFNFAIRTGMRNSYKPWVAKIKSKNAKTKKMEINKHIITTTGDKEHAKVKEVKSLEKFVKDYRNNEVDTDQINEVISTVSCKFLHQGEIFISADLKLWPCCFLWDSYFKNKENIREKLSEYPKAWNDLTLHSIEEIMQHEWFKKVLQESWYPNHKKHLARCILTCGHKQAYHNEIKVEK